MKPALPSIEPARPRTRRRGRIAIAVTLAAATAVAVPMTASAKSAPAGPVASPAALGDISWPNPYLAPRENNNIHVDSYSSDTYTIPGPTSAKSATVKLVRQVPDPTNPGTMIDIGLGGTQTFDSQGRLIIIGLGNQPKVILFDEDMNALSVRNLATQPQAPGVELGLPSPGFRDFAGGYYYLDQNDHPVIAEADRHIRIYSPVVGTPGNPGGWDVVRDIDLTDQVDSDEALYAVMPDKYGTLWWTTKTGKIGTVTLSGAKDLWQLPSDEVFTKSLSVDEGDAPELPSGVYTPSDQYLYRFQAETDGQISVAWQVKYDKGLFQKPGQIAKGTGTTPTIFRMGGKRFVTINDNATPMHINIYRAEVDTGGAPRLFAQEKPFGNRLLVADENSLIAFPTTTGAAILAENNWGYRTPLRASFFLTTNPGFSRIDITPDGKTKVTSVNERISVPSVVSQANITSGLVYTYEKRIDGWWYFTAMKIDDLSKQVFSVRTGQSTLRDPVSWNNNYSQLSIGNGDGSTAYVGVVGGIAQITFS